VGRINQGRPAGVQLGDVGVRRSVEDRLNGVDRWKVRRVGCACQVSVAGTIHSNAAAVVIVAAAEVGRVDEGAAGGVQLRHEGVGGMAAAAPVESRLQGVLGREVGRGGSAGDVGVAGAVHRDAAANVIVAASEICGVNQGSAGGVDLRYEGVLAANAATA